MIYLTLFTVAGHRNLSRYTLHSDNSHFSLLGFFHMALSQLHKDSITEVDQVCYPAYIDTQKRIRHHTYLYRIIDFSRTQKRVFCPYIGGTSLIFPQRIIGSILGMEKRFIVAIFFPGKGPHHPTPPHIYVKKNLGLKTLAQRVTDPWVFLQPRFGAGFVSCLSTDHSPSLAADSFADRVLDPAPLRYE